MKLGHDARHLRRGHGALDDGVAVLRHLRGAKSVDERETYVRRATPLPTSSAIDRRGARGTAEPFCETVAETSTIDSDRVPSRRFQYARPPAAATTRKKAILPMGITRVSFFVRTGFAFFVARLPTDAMVLSRVLNQAWPPVATSGAVGIRTRGPCERKLNNYLSRLSSAVRDSVRLGAGWAGVPLVRSGPPLVRPGRRYAISRGLN